MKTSEWKSAKLGDVAKFRIGGSFKRDEFTEFGTPVASVSDFASDWIDMSSCRYLPESLPSKYRKYALKEGDVVISTVGSQPDNPSSAVGKVVRVTEEADGSVLYQNAARIRAKEGQGNQRFLFYLLRSKYFRQHVFNNAHGSANQASVATGALKEYEFRCPPLPVQRRIADILGALDDKIELNRRMNRTLEEMAQTLYRHWFVDFGPFQDRAFKDTEELGPIPEGWEVGSLDDIIQNVRGTVDPEEFPDDFPYIGLGEMPEGSIHLSEWQEAQEAGSRKRHFKKGQFLFGKLRPYFKKVGVAPVEGICSSDMLVLEPVSENTRSMALGQLIQDDFIDFTDQASSGTSHPRISWKRMRGYQVALPPDDVAEKFEDILGDFIELVLSNIHENRSLAETRDYLLPKLISGEIEVDATEEAVEQATDETVGTTL